MTPEEFRMKMMEIAGLGDQEMCHGQADDLMCKVLCELGYDEGVAIFEDMDKWYA